MAVFEEVSLEWEGKKYVIPADDVLRGIAKVEEVITLGELAQYQSGARMPLAKLSAAFGVLLRHAGASVSNEHVYEGLFASGKARELQKRAITYMAVLYTLMVPPSSLKAPAGKPKAASRRAGSSQASTSSSSAKAG